MSAPTSVESVAEWFEAPELIPTLTGLREDLHRFPELAFEEHQTTDRLAAALEPLGIQTVNGQTPLTGRLRPTGLWVRILGRAGGRTVAIRGDIDALPIEELNEVPYCSERPGIMHACGHDVHATWALGAAALLARQPAAGDVVIVLQPAEEVGLGAAEVLASGVLDEVEMIFGAHVDPRWPVGTVVADDGPVAASADEFLIELHGRGGHGARPQLGRDPIVAAAAVVQQLQTIVSRQVTPGHGAVVTIGEMHAGSAPNVIPDSACLKGTIRSTSAALRSLLHREVERVATGTAGALGVEARFSLGPGTPALSNDPRATAFARAAARELFGETSLVQLDEPNMGGEDFGVYLEKSPGAFLRVGSRFASDPVIGAHTSRFFPQTESVFVGASLLAETARRASAHRE